MCPGWTGHHTAINQPTVGHLPTSRQVAGDRKATINPCLMIREASMLACLNPFSRRTLSTSFAASWTLIVPSIRQTRLILATLIKQYNRSIKKPVFLPTDLIRSSAFLRTDFLSCHTVWTLIIEQFGRKRAGKRSSNKFTVSVVLKSHLSTWSCFED